MNQWEQVVNRYKKCCNKKGCVDDGREGVFALPKGEGLCLWLLHLTDSHHFGFLIFDFNVWNHRKQSKNYKGKKWKKQKKYIKSKNNDGKKNNGFRILSFGSLRNEYPLFHVISKPHVMPKFLFNAEKFIETSIISALRVVSKLRERRDS